MDSSDNSLDNNSDNQDHDDDAEGSSASEEFFDDTDSFYTDIEDEESDEYISDINAVDFSNEDTTCGYICDDTEEEDSDDEEDQCLVEITKPYIPNKPAEEPSEYDDIPQSDWGNLKALIMMADGQGIAEWFSKRKVSPEAKINIAKVFSPLNLAARVNSLPIFNFLLGEGFPLNTIIHPFLDAALNHRFDIMDKLLDMGANVNVTDAAGTTALHLVARQVTCRPKKIRYLLSKGANIDLKDFSGMTPLHYALVMGSKGTIVTLLHAGASVNVQNGKGRPALHMAVYRGMKITAMLYDAGARPGTNPEYSEVMAAARIPNVNIVRFLIKRNASVDCSLQTLAQGLFHGEYKIGKELVDLLVGAGYSPRGNDVIILDTVETRRNTYTVEKLKSAAYKPRTLQELTCFKVRNIIRDTSLCISDAVQNIPLPEVLKDYLLLKHVTEIC